MLKTLLFVAETIPADSIGSAVIFHRHFQRLVTTGWTLHVVSHGSAPSGAFWRHCQLPTRQPGWAPVRRQYPLTVRLRAWQQRRWLARHLVDLPREGVIVVSQLWDDLCLLASQLAATRRWPLGVFHHDDEIGWEPDPRSHRFLRWKRQVVGQKADRLWPVSERLRDQLEPVARAKCRILRPIPGDFAGSPPNWNDVAARGLRLGYAGKTYGAFQPLIRFLAQTLAEHGGTLEVITDPENARQFHQSQPNLYARPFFAETAQAGQWLRENCSALFIGHPLDFRTVSPVWQILRTSFPSKLTEACQLGLPLVMVGNKDSALGDWADSRPGSPFFSDPQAPALHSYLESLKTRVGWDSAAAWVASLRQGEFSPERIHAEWAGDLEALLQRNST